MDRTAKILLGVIAASLVLLNLQLAGVKLEDVSLVSEAHAGMQTDCGCHPWLQGIENAIEGLELTCN